jgi:hypothetical protein
MTDMAVRTLIRSFLPDLILRRSLGSSAAKFAGENVHKRLASDAAFKSKSYEEALKHAYLGIDEDLRTGVLI